MKSLEEFKDAADRAFVLLEQKSPHQLAVELVSMEDRVQGAIDACARMQEQRDQLAFQLKDATSQCAVAADLLLELREGAEIHLHNCTVCKNEQGIVNWTSKLERIDALLAGKLPEPRITKQARVWGARFMPGVAEKTIIEAAYRYAEHEASEEERQAGKINFDLLMAAIHKTVPEGWQLVPVEPTESMIGHGCGASVMVVSEVVTAWGAMLAAAPKP